MEATLALRRLELVLLVNILFGPARLVNILLEPARLVNIPFGPARPGNTQRGRALLVITLTEQTFLATTPSLKTTMRKPRMGTMLRTHTDTTTMAPDRLLPFLHTMSSLTIMASPMKNGIIRCHRLQPTPRSPLMHQRSIRSLITCHRKPHSLHICQWTEHDLRLPPSHRP